MSLQDGRSNPASSYVLSQPLPSFIEPEVGARKALLVDDDPLILRALERLLRGIEGVELIICSDPREAMRTLAEDTIAVLVSDQLMPQMNGLELLRYAGVTSPNTICIMLTGERDMDLAVRALNNGDVFRFITKPWKNEHLIEMLRLALDQHQLKLSRQHHQRFIEEQNQRLQTINEELEARVIARTRDLEESRAKIRTLYQELEGSFDATLKLMLAIMEMGDAVIVDHCQRTAERVRQFSAYLDMPEGQRQALTRAAMLHWLGLVNAPRELFSKPQEHYSPEERAAWEFHPILGQQILTSIPSLHVPAQIILHYMRDYHQDRDSVHELFGAHEALPEELQRSCYILRICSAFEWERTWQAKRQALQTRRLYESAAHRLKMQSAQAYHPVLVEKFCACLEASREEDRQELVLYSITELKEGMVLARAIETPSGLPMVAAETTITRELIERLIFFEDTYDEWFDQICVWA